MSDQDQYQQTTVNTCLKAPFMAAVSASAAAGGGGRGMRIAHSEEELSPAMSTAATGAAAFKNGDIYVEKYDEDPRHIEILEVTPKPQNAINQGEISGLGVASSLQIITPAIVGTFYRAVAAGRTLRQGRPAGRGRHGRLHHRGDEADERDTGRDRRHGH
jgi:hypothetical protein